MRLIGDAAEFLIIDELGDGRMIAAHRALRIAPQLQFAEAHRQRIVQHQPANQGLADAQDQLHGFGGLNQSDRSGQNAEHPAFGAAGNQARRWRLRIQASIAGAARIREDRGLPFEAEDRSVHVRLLQQHARVIHQVTRREIIGAVDYDVVVFQNIERVLAGQRNLVPVDLDIRIDVEHGLGRRIQLLLADVLGPVNHLALQVGEIHHVEIHQADAADARRGEIHAERRA